MSVTLLAMDVDKVGENSIWPLERDTWPRHIGNPGVLVEGPFVRHDGKAWPDLGYSWRWMNPDAPKVSDSPPSRDW